MSAEKPAESAPLTESAEFKAALAASEAKMEAKFASMAEELGKKLQAAGGSVQVPTGVDITSILSTLALEIGKVSDQGTDRKRVAPEELVARTAAFERMGALLTAAQARPQKDWPRYKLVAKMLLNDRIMDPIRRTANNEVQQVQILHRGMPNVGMRPVDESAKEIYREFIRYLGGSQEANSIAPASPLWLTTKGTVVASTSESGRKFSAELSVEPIIVDGEDISTTPGGKSSFETMELIGQHDPRAKEINVLGTIADSAKVGQVAPRAL